MSVIRKYWSFEVSFATMPIVRVLCIVGDRFGIFACVSQFL